MRRPYRGRMRSLRQSRTAGRSRRSTTRIGIRATFDADPGDPDAIVGSSKDTRNSVPCP